MSETFHCDDKDTLMAFLYDEADAPMRRRVEDHLRGCAACTDEVAALSGVRAALSCWAPPQVEFGFAAARKADENPPPARWWSEVPAWAQLAAAVLVLAAGAAMANVQVRYGVDGVVVTTGWMAPVGAVVPARTAQAAATDQSGADAWKPALAALESQLRDEIRAGRVVAPAGSPRLASRAGEDEMTVKRVQELLDASERRQRQELALRLTQLGRDMDVQRRADLVRIDQGFGQFEGRTGAEMARQRQMLNYVMRVSQPPQQ